MFFWHFERDKKLKHRTLLRYNHDLYNWFLIQHLINKMEQVIAQKNFLKSNQNLRHFSFLVFFNFTYQQST